MADEINFEPDPETVDFQPFSPVLASVFADPHDLAVYRRARAAGLSDAQAIRGGHGDNGVSYYGDDTTNPNDPIVALPPDTPGFRHNRKIELTGPDGQTGIARLSEHMPATRNLKGDASIDLNPAAAALVGHPGGVYPVSWRFVDDPGPAELKQKIDFSPEPAAASSGKIDFTAEEPAAAKPGRSLAGTLGDVIASVFSVDKRAVESGVGDIGQAGAFTGQELPAPGSPDFKDLERMINEPNVAAMTHDQAARIVQKVKPFAQLAVPELRALTTDAATGLLQGGSEFSTGMTSLKNLALMGSLAKSPTIVSELVAIGYAPQTAQAVYEHAKAATQAKTTSEAGRESAIALGSLATLGAIVGSVAGIEGPAIARSRAAARPPIVEKPVQGRTIEPETPLALPPIDFQPEPPAGAPPEPAPAAPQTALKMIEQRMGSPEPAAPAVEPLAPDPAPLTPAAAPVEPVTPAAVAAGAIAPTQPPPVAPPGEETLSAVYPVVTIPMSQVAVRPALMQFKQSDDQASGTNRHDRIDTPYDPLKAGVTVVWEPQNPQEYDLAPGEHYIVVNGHHRDEKRREEKIPSFSAQVLREAEGVSALDARRIGAEINIADGKGTIFDQANWIRDTATVVGPDVALARGRALGNRGRKASNIALAAADDLYTAFINERISPDHAEAIALAAPRQAGLQRAGLNLALKGASPQDSANLVQALKAKAAAGPAAKQGGFPWDDDEEIVRAEALGKRATAVQKEISERLASVQGAARRPEKAGELGVNISDPAAVQARIVQLQNLREVWRRFGGSLELIHQLQSNQTPAEIIQTGLAATPAAAVAPTIPPDEQTDILLHERPADLKRYKSLVALRDSGEITPAQSVELEQIERSMGQSFLDIPERDPAALAAAHAARQRELDLLEIRRRQQRRLVGADIETQTGIFGPETDKGGNLTLFEKSLPNKQRRARKGYDPLQLQLDLFAGHAGIGTAPLQTLGGGYSTHAGGAGSVVQYAGLQPAAGPLSPRATQLRAIAIQRALILGPKSKELIGRYAPTHGALADILQPYRTPLFETFRWKLVDRATKKIIRIIPVSLRLPGSTAILPFISGKSWRQQLEEIGALADQLNAVIWASHNHPGGNPNPGYQSSDRSMTREASKILGDRFMGHIIINHGSYYFLRYFADGSEDPVSGIYPVKNDLRLLQPEPGLEHPLLNREVADAPDMVAVAQQLQIPKGFVSIAMLDNRLKIRGIYDMDPARFRDLAAVTLELQQMAREVGGRRAVLYHDGTGLKTQILNNLRTLIHQNVLWDAVLSPTTQPLMPVMGPPDRMWMGINTNKMLAEIVDEPADGQLGTTIQVGSKRSGYREVELRQLDKIPIADLPALVELTRQLGLDVPRIQRLAKARGYFRHGPGGEEIALDFRIFADPVIAAKVLAHEIGHLADFLPDGTMKRGNLLGRLATLQNYLMATLPIDPKGGAQAMTKDDRIRLRKAAAASVGPRPRKHAPDAEKKAWSEAVNNAYLKLINDELRTRGLASDAGKKLINNVREELIALSDWWKPFLDDAAEGKLPDHYIAYRTSGVELYADMISVLLNSPADVKERAPVTFQTLFNYLDRKPSVRDAFFEAWDLLGPDGERRLAARRQKIQSMFQDGQEILNRAIDARQKTPTWRAKLNALRTGLDTRYWPAIARERAAAKAGGLTAARRPLEWLFDAHPLADNEVYVWMHRNNEAVRKPLLAAGLTEADLGEYLFFDRIRNESYELSEKLAQQMENDHGGRAHLANPAGHTPTTAEEQLAFLEAKLGSQAYQVLQTAAQRSREIFFEVADRMRAEGMIGDEAWGIVVANKDAYAPFLALAYADLHVPAGIKHQIGYLGDIANPYTAQILKAITALRAIEFNKAKRITVAHLQEYFGISEAAPAPGKWNGRRSVPQPPRDPELALVTFMAGGKQVGVHVARELHDMLEYNESSAVEVLTKILSPLHWMWQQVFYPSYITFSPLFQLFRNPVRDIRRTAVNLPNEANMLQAISTRWGETRQMVKQWVKEGKITPEILEALDARAVPPPMGTWQRQMAGEDMFLAIAGRFGLARPGLVKEGHWVERIPIAGRLFRALATTGQIRELVPKIGAYRLLTKELGFSPEDAAGYVRSYIGTPNWIKKGTWTHLGNDIFPFLNVWSKGWQADARMMRGRTQGPSGTRAKTAGSWWIRWLLTGALPKVVMAAAAAGIFGETLRRLYGRVGGYWMQNYDVIPIGERPGGKIDGNLTVFVPVPKDATDRVLGGFVYLLSRAAFDWAMSNRQVVSPGQGPALGTSDMPSINPSLKLINGWGTYLAGGNPYDSFRNQHVLTDQQIEAGWKYTLGSMLGWTWNQQGGSTFIQYNPDVQSVLETTLSAIPGANGMIKWSDTGLREAAGSQQREQLGERARIALDQAPEVQKLRTEYNWLKSVGEAHRTPTMQGRYKVLSTWNKNVYEPFVEASEYDNQDHAATVKILSKPFQDLGR